MATTVHFPSLAFAQSPEFVQPNDGIIKKETDWPWWRGPNRNGEASPNQSPPTQWSDSERIRWKAKVPGRGHGSMCLYGPVCFLVTSDEKSGSQSLIAYRRDDGKPLFETLIHPKGGMRKNEKSTAASSTPACDGERVYVTFPNSDALWVSAVTLDGRIEWQQRISDYVEHQGYGASPAIYQNLVIVASDNKSGGAIAALDRKSGRIIWKRDRPKLPNYPSPIIVHAFGRDQLIMTGCDLVTSLDPNTGATLWETPGATTECVISTVTDGELVFTSGGYPKNHMSAILADGTKKLVWENESRLYVPSPLVRSNVLYGVLDAGIAVSWNSKTGKENWRQRLGGTFSASPVLVGDKIYATSEAGETFIFRADPNRFEQLGRNQLGNEVLATPVICDGKIFYRCAEFESDSRAEYLYCIGER